MIINVAFTCEKWDFLFFYIFYGIYNWNNSLQSNQNKESNVLEDIPVKHD